jgi:Ni/Fe-hydrogenase subunit HybB-like protein
VIGWAAYAYYVQLRDGLGVTGLRDYVFWGIYTSISLKNLDKNKISA